MKEEIAVLEKCGLNKKFLESVSLKNDKITYIFDYNVNNNIIQSRVNIKQLSNGDVVLNITEGELTNDVGIKKNGEIFVDGEV